MTKDILTVAESIYLEIIELRSEQTDFRVNMAKHITTMSRDTEWMRKKLDNMNDKFDKCGFCNNPEEVSSFKKTIQELKNENSKVKYIAIGGATVLSVMISVILWIFENKDKILQ